MSDFVVFFFELSNNTKLYHWMTTSFARHKASDTLFESIIELSDEFMETYMGKYGRPKMSSTKTSLKTLNDKSVLDYYKTCIAFLEGEFVKTLSKDDTDLFNLRDELLGKLRQTLYLFTLN
jgi:hypothetical protein